VISCQFIVCLLSRSLLSSGGTDKSFLDFFTLEDGTNRLSWNVVKELHHYTLRNIPEDRRSHVLHCGSLKSCRIACAGINLLAQKSDPSLRWLVAWLFTYFLHECGKRYWAFYWPASFDGCTVSTVAEVHVSPTRHGMSCPATSHVGALLYKDENKCRPVPGCSLVIHM
jgi:hypothetical protein